MSALVGHPEHWCQCNHDDSARAEHLDEGHCDVCGLPERDYFVGAVLVQIEDLNDEQRAEVMLLASEEA